MNYTQILERGAETLKADAWKQAVEPRAKEPTSIICLEKSCDFLFDAALGKASAIVTEHAGHRFSETRWNHLLLLTGSQYGAYIIRSTACPGLHKYSPVSRVEQRFAAYLDYSRGSSFIDKQKQYFTWTSSPSGVDSALQRLAFTLSRPLSRMLFLTYGASYWGTYLQAEPKALIHEFRRLAALAEPKKDPITKRILKLFKPRQDPAHP